MPKDSRPTRSAILAAAVQTLKREGLDGFAIDAVARRAGVAKGLVAYHFTSRRRLLAACGAELAAERRRRLAPGSVDLTGPAAVDACWEELRRQQQDGLAQAWLSLSAAGVIDRADSHDPFEDVARELLLDGCTVALSAGVPLTVLEDAFDASSLALLALIEGG